ncbi:guanine deaminase [Bombina bombina]|uniref:guanine deaminase n=1 Tax=Bombina bombina TaxID=8345 RepID=UPI00235AD655|nr:guanine deaminase [Bombina bombina]
MATLQHVFRGTFVHSTNTCAMEIKENHILGVDSTGKIAFFEDAGKQAELSKKWGFDKTKIEELGKNDFFMPGMIDTHIHASQYAFVGSAMDKPLLEWLEHTTFPTEEKYKDLNHASDLYRGVVCRTLKNGTTTACYFATIHTDASLSLADLTHLYGQRAFIGKVCMDCNTSYPKYIESTEDSIKETERFVEALKNKKYARVKPVVTPRFAISCSEKLLMGLGKLAQKHDIHIQSHISESTAEIKEVLRLFPDYNTYTDVYNKNKLLTNKTVMAHGCYLSNEELAEFRTKGTAISHCPNSNIALCSGHLDVRNVINQKVKLGLGTDIAGGYSVSILDAIRKAIETSKILCIQHHKNLKKNKNMNKHQNEKHAENGFHNIPNGKEVDNDYKVLSHQEAFRLATLGGCEALSIDKITGNFEVNKEFDALLINPEVDDSPFEVFPNTPMEVVVERFIYLGDDRNIKTVYVAGRRVFPFPEDA